MLERQLPRTFRTAIVLSDALIHPGDVGDDTATMTEQAGNDGQSEHSADRWRALALLALMLVLSMSTWFSASAVIPQLRVQWNLSDSAAAWLTIAVQLGFVCGALTSSLLNLS